jgi:hypothetical protein
MSEIRKITLKFPSLRAFLAEYGELVSTDGILLRSDSPPAAGSTVDIEVVLADGMRLLQARGETLWSGATDASGRQGAAAVRFDELDEASRTLLDRIVDQRRVEGAEAFVLEDLPRPREDRLRDLTVPAAAMPAGPAAPVKAAEESIFDLAEPPAVATEDLFSAVVRQPETATPRAAEESAPTRRPTPPVPLLADPEPAPFDLESEAPEPAPPERGADRDLSELFGSEEPPKAPERGRTEAFPASFVDEVEAELEATGTPMSSPPAVDSGEPEDQIAVSEDEPEPALPALEVEPIEAAPAPVEIAAEPLVEIEPVPELVAEPESEPEAEPEMVAEPEPPLSPAAPEPPEATPPAVPALDVEHGPETVEIPIIAPRSRALPLSAAEPSTAEPPAATEPLPSVDETPPPVEMPSPVLPGDDNLLSIPELNLEATPAADVELPAPRVEMPSSAQSLRGAASSSHHVGTWILIVLLVGALGVAGYYLVGMVGSRTESASPEAPTTVSAPAVETVEPTPEQEAAEAPLPPEDDAATVSEEPAPIEQEPSEPEPPAAEQPVVEQFEPAALLSGLDRITWTETDSETILELVGDGAIPRRNIELATIGGDQPRLVIKISGVQRPFQPAMLEVATPAVRRVRTGLQAGGQLHVVVDLAVPGVSVRDLVTRGSRVELRLGVD